MVLKAYRYRLYPNKTQRVLINKHFGCTRFVYNWGLDTKVKQYEKDKSRLSCFDLTIKMKNTIKQDNEWLKEVNSQSLQMSLRNLDNAFTRFFKQKKGFPNFKNRYGRQSFQCPQNVSVNFENKTISVPKIKNIKVALSRRFEGKIKTTTISRVPSGKYFVSILVETSDNLPAKPPIKEETTVGVDLGIKHFIITSNGDKVSNPKHLNKSLDNLRYKQYKMAKQDSINKKKGIKCSKRREKQKKKIARIHERISNQRSDFLHKLTYRLTHENQVSAIAVEDLNVNGMMKNRKLSRSISDVSWGRFVELLSYKCYWYGKHLLKIGRFEPSSKLCSKCGWRNNNLTLKDREWICQDCSTKHDRDINAARNIKNFALVEQNLLTVVPLEERELTLRENVSLETSVN